MILPISNEKNHPTNFLLIFFKFTYYLGLSPFRIVIVTLPGKNKLGFLSVSWKPQKVVCVVMNSLCVFRLMTELRMSSIQPGQYAKYPELYFRYILRIFAFAYKVTAIKRFWLNSEDFINLLNYIKNTPLLPITNRKIQKQSFIKCMCGLSVGVAIADLVCGAYFVGQTWRLSPSWWFRQLVSHARYSFLIGPFPKLDTAPDLCEIRGVDIVLAFVTATSFLQRYTMGLFCDLCILSHVMTLWSVVSTFADKNQNKATKRSKVAGSVTTEGLDCKPILERKWNTVYEEYKTVRKLSMLINDALGHLVTGFMAEAVIFYSINLDVTLVTADFYKKIYMFYFYFNTVSILVVSADICNKMNSLKTWLTKDENRKDIPFDEMHIVLQETICNEVGIRGSGIFTITYSLVASYCSLVVTYFIISVQHRDQLQPNALDG